MCPVTELSLSLDPGRGGLGLFFGALTTNIHGASEAMRRTRLVSLSCYNHILREI